MYNSVDYNRVLFGVTSTGTPVGITWTIWRNVLDADDALTTPDQGCSITIIDPDGNVAVALDTTNITDAAMDVASTGLYIYYFHTLITDKKGEWNFSCKATDGTGDDAKYDIVKGSFNLT